MNKILPLLEKNCQTYIQRLNFYIHLFDIRNMVIRQKLPDKKPPHIEPPSWFRYKKKIYILPLECQVFLYVRGSYANIFATFGSSLSEFLFTTFMSSPTIFQILFSS